MRAMHGGSRVGKLGCGGVFLRLSRGTNPGGRSAAKRRDDCDVGGAPARRGRVKSKRGQKSSSKRAAVGAKGTTRRHAAEAEALPHPRMTPRATSTAPASRSSQHKLATTNVEEDDDLELLSSCEEDPCTTSADDVAAPTSTPPTTEASASRRPRRKRATANSRTPSAPTKSSPRRRTTSSRLVATVVAASSYIARGTRRSLRALPRRFLCAA
mmetsp:Transcript_6310/g.26486  ORF Transcript_6310/g.26486 Transcript_6310/m.26486 type:complete len:213 (-) Transcript_6310:343-981(-)